MINSPKEIFRIWVNNGKNKAALPALNMYLLGILAGLYRLRLPCVCSCDSR